MALPCGAEFAMTKPGDSLEAAREALDETRE